MAILKVGATQFDLSPVADSGQFWARVTALTRKASTAGAQIVLFPEYFAIPWLMTFSPESPEQAWANFAQHDDEFHNNFQQLAKVHQLVIVAGSVPIKIRQRRANRSFIYLPDGRRFEQDKQSITQKEKVAWGISSGTNQIRYFEWKGAGIGIAISYDVEFPSYVRELIDQDVDVILVPSFTADHHAYWRVRHCAQARAVESQSFVVMSSAVGPSPILAKGQSAYGRAGFFTPCDLNFPEAGILAVGDLNREDVHVHELDMSELERVREEGSVLIRRDITET